MLLPVALICLVLTGCWLYSLTDALLTPAVAYRGWSKVTWVSLIIVTVFIGAVAWLMTRHRRRHDARSRYGRAYGRMHGRMHGGRGNVRNAYRWTAADEAVARHPAGRYRETGATGWHAPRGPDDDPEFLKELDRLIHGEDRA